MHGRTVMSESESAPGEGGGRAITAEYVSSRAPFLSAEEAER